MFKMSYRTIGSAGTLALLYPFLAGPARALPPPPPNATNLQQIMFNAIANMCVNALDARTPAQRQAASANENDLHDQCHAVAVSNLTNPTGSTAADAALGALQQVSGNQTSTQGALTTRVSAGQFGNITGRLNALRFGSGVTLSQGLTAQNTGFGSSFGTQMFSFDRASLDSAREGYSQPIALQSPDSMYGGSLIKTSYGGDGSYRVAQAGNSSGASGGGFASSAVQNPWGVFLQGSYNSGHHDQTDNEDPFSFHAVSVTAGVDYNFGNAVLGVAVGHDNFDAGIRPSGTAVSSGGTRVKSTSGSIYGAWFGPAWYVNGIVNYGNLKSDLSREVKYSVSYNYGADVQTIPGQTDVCTPSPPTAASTCTVSVDRVLTASPSGNAYAVGATAGYQYSAFGWDLSPSLSLNYRKSKFDAYSENDPTLASDGLALSFAEHSIESLRSILGVQASTPISASFGVVSPVVRLEWNHEFKTGERSIAAHYAFDPSCKNGTCLSDFALPTDTPASNYGVAGVGVIVTLAGRVQAFVFDEAQFGYSNYHSNSVTIGVRGQF